MSRRLVVYGCSFTEGDELSDHEIFDLISVNEMEQMKDTIHPFPYFADYRNMISSKWFNGSMLDMQKIVNSRKTKAWPAKLGKLMDLEVINHGLSGATNEDLIHRVTLDYHTGNNTEDDIVIIASTTPVRFGFFDKSSLTDRMLTLHTNVPYIPEINLSREWQYEFQNKIFTPAYFMLHYYRNLMLICGLLDKHKNLFWTECVWHRHAHIAGKDTYSTMQEQTEVFDLYCNLLSEITHDKCLDASFCDITTFWDDSGLPNMTEVHGRYHPKEHKHAEYAALIFEKIKQYDT